MHFKQEIPVRNQETFQQVYINLCIAAYAILMELCVHGATQLRVCPEMLSTLQMYIVHGVISAQFLVEILSLGGPFALEVFKIFAYRVIFVIKLYRELLSSPCPETCAIALACIRDTRAKP